MSKKEDSPAGLEEEAESSSEEESSSDEDMEVCVDKFLFQRLCYSSAARSV